MKKLLIVLSIIFSLSASAQTKQDSAMSKQVAIILPVWAWQVVLKGLQELPMKESGTIVQEIVAQANKETPPPKKK